MLCPMMAGMQRCVVVQFSTLLPQAMSPFQAATAQAWCQARPVAPVLGGPNLLVHHRGCGDVGPAACNEIASKGASLALTHPNSARHVFEVVVQISRQHARGVHAALALRTRQLVQQLSLARCSMQPGHGPDACMHATPCMLHHACLTSCMYSWYMLAAHNTCQPPAMSDTARHRKFAVCAASVVCARKACTCNGFQQRLLVHLSAQVCVHDCHAELHRSIAKHAVSLAGLFVQPEIACVTMPAVDLLSCARTARIGSVRLQLTRPHSRACCSAHEKLTAQEL